MVYDDVHHLPCTGKPGVAELTESGQAVFNSFELFWDDGLGNGDYIGRLNVPFEHARKVAEYLAAHQ